MPGNLRPALWLACLVGASLIATGVLVRFHASRITNILTQDANVWDRCYRLVYEAGGATALFGMAMLLLALHHSLARSGATADVRGFDVSSKVS